MDNKYPPGILYIFFRISIIRSIACFYYRNIINPSAEYEVEIIFDC